MKWQGFKKFLCLEWILLAVIFIVLFLNFLYSDILITVNASIVFDDLFFKGDLYHLYEATYKTFDGILAGAYITYDFPIYIFFGLWNLPLWLYQTITGNSWILSYFTIIYAKLFLVFLTIISLVIMKKILAHYKLNDEDKMMYSFLFLSSSLVMMVIAMFAGYDILSIVFVLLGIYYYLKDDLRMFVLFFAIAITLKLFALFIFIPLLLLKEKNIWKIIGYGIMSVSLLILSKLIYMNAPMYYESMSAFESNMLGKLSLSYIASPFGNISIFITIYMLICCWCFNKKIDDKKLVDLYTMYIPLIVYGFLCIFCQAHPQWTILMMPYLIFFLVYNKANRTTNILLESAFSVATLLIFYQVYTWVFNPTLMNHMLINRFIPQINGITTLTRFQIDSFSPIINGVMLATFLYFLWINRPEKIVKEKTIEKWNRSLLLLRLGIIIPFAAIIVYYYFR